MEKYTRTGKSAQKDKGHMRSGNKYVKETQKLRREISQIAAEIGGIKSNDKLTARQRRNRRWMLKETKRRCAVKDFIQLKESRLRLQLHCAIYRPDSFVLMLRYCVNLKAIRYESTSFNRIVAYKSHRVIVA